MKTTYMIKTITGKKKYNIKNTKLLSAHHQAKNHHKEKKLQIIR